MSFIHQDKNGSESLKPVELYVQICPFCGYGDAALLVPFIQPDYTEVGSIYCLNL